MRYSLRWLQVTIFLICLLLAAGRGLFLAMLPPMEYVVQGSFAEMPETDEALLQWLASQPDVSVRFVMRPDDGHSPRDTVIIVWGHRKTNYDDPITPDVRSKLESFGYRGEIRCWESKGRLDK